MKAASTEPAPATMEPPRRAPPGAVRLAARLLVLAVAYYVGARFGTLLAIPPGYASAFWIPAGIALMALLTGGSQLWPGVLAGSFAHNMLVSAATGGGGAETVLLSAVLAGGASLQAVAGAKLVRRYVGFPTALTGVAETVRFLLLGGPLSCVISASIGIAALAIGHSIPPGAIAFNWFNWWAGDAIGVLLVVPLWLVAVGEPRAFWRGRWATVAAPVVATVLAAIGGFAIAQRQEGARIHAEFAARAEGLRRRIEDALDDDIVLLDAVRAHFEAVPSTDASSFAIVASTVVSRHGSFKALEWAPVVRGAERGSFEKNATAAGARAFAIRERAADGGLAERAAADRYVPVRFVEPLAGNEAALGFDLASEPDRRAAIEAAARSGNATLTQPLQLVQVGGGEVGLLAFVPVVGAARGDALPSGAVSGFVVGVIAVSPLLDAALGSVDATGLSFRLVDQSEPRRPQALAERRQSPARAFEDELGAAALQGYGVTKVLRVPGRTWRLDSHPTLSFLDSMRSPMPWLVQISGLAFAALIGTLLLNLSGRKQEVVQEVAVRTRELSERNRQLTHEIGQREKAQTDLKRSEERYRALIEQAPLMVAIARGNRFIYANRRYLDAHGIRSFDDLVGTPVLERVAPRARATWLARTEARQHGLPADKRYEATALHVDGTEFPVVAFADLIELPDGPAVIGFFEDQTERIAMQTARRESEARFEAAFENSANGIAIEDRSGRILRANPALCSLLGYAREELVGRNRYDLTYPGDLAGSVERASALWSGAISSYQHEQRCLRKDGRPVWTGISCALISDDADQPQHLVVQVQDLTERKRLEKALLEATNNEQQRLGHELHDGLGQELTGMSMLVAALASSERKAGRVVHRNLEELEKIAKRTIATCRAIAHGLSPLSYVRGDLVEALRELVALQHEAYGARTHFDSIGSAPLSLPPDSLDHLYRIAQEAISNARRHAQARTIDVRLTVDPGFVRVEIVDDGIGLTLPAGVSPGMGVKIMQYRAGMIGATLSIGSGSDGGTHITCECPQRRTGTPDGAA